MKLLVGAWVTGCVGGATLPWPVSTSYASLNPSASAGWMVRYLGAEAIGANWSVDERCGNVSWVRMPGSGYEFHFVSSPLVANASFSFADYVAYVDDLYGHLSEQSASTYDQFMDFHVGMIVDDMTPFYERMKSDGVEFFMIGQYPAFFDLFVEIPHTGAILEMTSQRLDVPNATLSAWDICQVAAEPPRRRLEARKDRTEGWPQVNWRKTTLAAPHPLEFEAFAIKYLNATHIQQGHVGVWLRGCAKIAWIDWDYVGPAGIPYQLHMVDGYSYPPKRGLDVPGFAQLQDAQRHYDENRMDEWSHNHLALWVEDLTPYYRAFERDNVSALLRTDGALITLLVDTALSAGNVLALVSDRLDDDVVEHDDIVHWKADFCAADATAAA